MVRPVQALGANDDDGGRKSPGELAEIVTNDADTSFAAAATCVVGGRWPMACGDQSRSLYPNQYLLGNASVHPVGDFAPGEMVPIHPNLGYPNLAPVSDSSAHPSLHQRNPPFDALSIPLNRYAIQTSVYNQICQAKRKPPPPRRPKKPLCTQTHRCPAAAHRYRHLSPIYARCLSCSFVNSGQDSSPGNASVMIEDKPYSLCGNFSLEEMIGCNEPDCDTEWFHFTCMGIGPKAKPEGVNVCFSIGPVTTFDEEVSVIKRQHTIY